MLLRRKKKAARACGRSLVADYEQQPARLRRKSCSRPSVRENARQERIGWKWNDVRAAAPRSLLRAASTFWLCVFSRPLLLLRFWRPFLLEVSASQS
jgi:hypothetical protein